MSRLWAGLRTVALLLGITMIVVTVTPVVDGLGALLAGRWDEARGDTLIVLTGSSLENGVIGESSYWRSVYAVLFWREMQYRTIWITGHGDGARTAAELMRDFLVGQGVPGERIRVETASRNTRESAAAMARILAADGGRKVLLTSDYHMFRSRRMFARAGLPVATLPVPDARKRGGHWRTRWPAFLDVAEEMTKIVWYGVRGML
jgi:uncharacterized SAM-binding protein YcdF (DUF218 family)